MFFFSKNRADIPIGVPLFTMPSSPLPTLSPSGTVQGYGGFRMLPPSAGFERTPTAVQTGLFLPQPQQQPLAYGMYPPAPIAPYTYISPAPMQPSAPSVPAPAPAPPMPAPVRLITPAPIKEEPSPAATRAPSGAAVGNASPPPRTSVAINPPTLPPSAPARRLPPGEKKPGFAGLDEHWLSPEEIKSRFPSSRLVNFPCSAFAILFIPRKKTKSVPLLLLSLTNKPPLQNMEDFTKSLGLTKAQAAELLVKNGPNQLTPPKQTPWCASGIIFFFFAQILLTNIFYFSSLLLCFFRRYILLLLQFTSLFMPLLEIASGTPLKPLVWVKIFFF